MNQLGSLLETKSRQFGHPVYILSDEPYRRIYYGKTPPVSSLSASPFTLICTSYSKELSIPGERLGYILVHPDCPDADTVIDALTFCNRILGFVNAPALMQRALALAPRAVVDIEPYRENRDLLVSALSDMGFDIVPPDGAFYLFPKSPTSDEMTFISALKEERILVVPGRGFGRSGYFRISYCVDRIVIERALPGFRRVRERF
jgi:aspartate aminotransferase